MENISFKPTAGVILIDPIEKETSGFITNKEPRKGTVVAVGSTLTTDFNALIECPCEVGQIIHRASMYEGDVYLDNKRYELVRFQDVKGIYAK